MEIIFAKESEFDREDCCCLLDYLSLLKAIRRPLFTHLLRTVLKDLHNISMTNVGHLLHAVTVFDEGRFTRRLLRALPSAVVDSSEMSLYDCRFVMIGLVKLSSPQMGILNCVIDFLLSQDLEALLVSELKDLSIIITNLAILVVSARVLFERVGAALDRVCESMPVSALISDITWACVSHGVFPVRVLSAVLAVLPSALHDWSVASLVRFQQVHAVVSTRAELVDVPKLSEKSFTELMSLLKRNNALRIPAGGKMCLASIKTLVGRTNLQKNFITDEGSVVYGALLVTPAGRPTSWPSDLSTVNKGWLGKNSLRLVAVMPFGPSFFSNLVGVSSNHTQMLGPLIMHARALQQAGWSFVLIPWASWSESKNRQDFLYKLLKDSGVNIPRPPNMNR